MTEEELEQQEKRDATNIGIHKCLEEIKKDLRHLPCQSGKVEECLQNDSIKLLAEGIKKSNKAYEICHKEKIEPLISSNLLLNEKVDYQQQMLAELKNNFDKYQSTRTEQRIADKQDLVNLQLNLTNAITQIQTEKETKKVTQEAHMKLVKWFIGIILGGIAVWTFISQIIERLL